jgi:hypothetical protein
MPSHEVGGTACGSLFCCGCAIGITGQICWLSAIDARFCWLSGEVAFFFWRISPFECAKRQAAPRLQQPDDSKPHIFVLKNPCVARSSSSVWAKRHLWSLQTPNLMIFLHLLVFSKFGLARRSEVLCAYEQFLPFSQRPCMYRAHISVLKSC